MFEHFIFNKTFQNRLGEASEQTREQLSKLFRRTHNGALDWYFTKDHDLRCGKRPLSSKRASAVCFTIWIKNHGQLSIPAIEGLQENVFPLTAAGLAKLESHIKDCLENRAMQGSALFPNDYLIAKTRGSFDKRVKKSLDYGEEALRARLKLAPKKPPRRTVTVTVFDRNWDVVAAVLIRAKGKCERCRNEAPFLRQTDNTPYLEVHHKTPLICNGDDTVENAIALCPNCHRLAHHGYPDDWPTGGV